MDIKSNDVSIITTFLYFLPQDDDKKQNYMSRRTILTGNDHDVATGKSIATLTVRLNYC